MQYTLVTEENFESLKDNIDTKASKKSLANTDRRLQAMYDLQNGQTWSMMIDEDADNPKASPDGSALATVTELGGKTVVWNQYFNIGDPTQMTPTRGTVSVQDGVVTLTKTGLTGSIAGFGCKFPVDHKIYASFDALRQCLPDSATAGVFCRAVAVVGARKEGNIYSAPYNVWTHINTIQHITEGIQWLCFRIASEAENGATTKFKNAYLVDLTQMFGSGNEPATTDDARIKWIEQYASLHPAYNEGELVSADVKAVESVGKNLWDGKKESGYWDVSDGQKKASASWTRCSDYIDAKCATKVYAVCQETQTVGGFGYILCYDVNKNYLGYVGNANGYTLLDKTRYITMYYNSRWSTNVSITNNSNVYVPYKSTTFTLPTAVRTQYPLRSAGTVYDEIKYDGQKWWHVKNVGVVDLGTLTWSEDGSYCYFAKSSSIQSKGAESVDKNGNIIVDKFSVTSWRKMYSGGESNAFAIHTNGNIDASFLQTYSTPSEFKTAMNGVIMYYELATPVTTDITSLMQDWDGTLPTETGGTITFVCADNTLWQVPNTVEYAVRLSEVVGGGD